MILSNSLNLLRMYKNIMFLYQLTYILRFKFRLSLAPILTMLLIELTRGFHGYLIFFYDIQIKKRKLKIR